VIERKEENAGHERGFNKIKKFCKKNEIDVLELNS
jgi:hypothetical protein